MKKSKLRLVGEYIRTGISYIINSTLNSVINNENKNRLLIKGLISKMYMIRDLYVSELLKIKKLKQVESEYLMEGSLIFLELAKNEVKPTITKKGMRGKWVLHNTKEEECYYSVSGLIGNGKRTEQGVLKSEAKQDGLPIGQHTHGLSKRDLTIGEEARTFGEITPLYDTNLLDAGGGRNKVNLPVNTDLVRYVSKSFMEFDSKTDALPRLTSGGEHDHIIQLQDGINAFKDKNSRVPEYNSHNKGRAAKSTYCEYAGEHRHCFNSFNTEDIIPIDTYQVKEGKNVVTKTFKIYDAPADGTYKIETKAKRKRIYIYRYEIIK